MDGIPYNLDFVKHLLFLLCLCPLLLLAQSSDFEEGKQLFEAKKYGKANFHFKKVLQESPKNIKAIEYLGDIAGIGKQWNLAISYYKQLLELDSKNANYHYKYGGVLGMKAIENKLGAIGLVGKISKAFKTAAELDPDHIDARWALLEYYIQLPGIIGGSVKKAGHYANELEGINKIEGMLAKAYIADYEKDWQLAKKYQREALELSDSITASYPRNTIHYQLAKACAGNNIKLDLGLVHSQLYIDKHKESDSVSKEWAYYIMAKLYRLKGDKQKALKALNIANGSKEVRKYCKGEFELINAL